VFNLHRSQAIHCQGTQQKTREEEGGDEEEKARGGREKAEKGEKSCSQGEKEARRSQGIDPSNHDCTCSS
jgi:hypothetical protein